MIRTRYAKLGIKLPPTICNEFYIPPVVLTSINIIGDTLVEFSSSNQYTCVGTYSDGTSGEVQPYWEV